MENLLEQNLIELLEKRVNETPNKKIYYFLAEGEHVTSSLTYQELSDQAKTLANYLQRQGFEKERAILFYPSGTEFIVSFFACMYAGVIAVPAYPPRKNRLSARIKSIVKDAKPKLILTNKDIVFKIDENDEELQGMRVIKTNELQLVKARLAAPNIEAKQLSFLQYTSGSTGDPKGVMISHGNIISNLKELAEICPAQESNVMVSWLPIFHDMGLIFGILFPFYRNFPCYFFPPEVFVRNPIKWLNALSRFKGTHSAAPNFAYDLCTKISKEKRRSLDLSKWKFAFNGAEPIRRDTIEKFNQHFSPYGLPATTVLTCYGMAETTLVATATRNSKPNYYTLKTSDQLPTSFAGCGMPSSFSEVIIHDTTKNQAAKEGAVGEIWVKSPSVAQGYWKKKEKTKETFHNYLANGDGPYLSTGDLGFKQHHEIVVTGRIKDLIIINGKNIYPQDIEQSVEKSHPDLSVNAGAAFSIQTKNGEQLIVVQEISRNAWRSFNGPEITQSIQKQLFQEHEISPYAICLLKPHGMLKTSSGKIQRSACKTGFLEQSLSTLYTWQRDQEITANQAPPKDKLNEESDPKVNAFTVKKNRDWLVEQVQILLSLSAEQIRTDQVLSFLGMNSVQVIRLAGIIEEELDIPFSPTLFYDYPTIDALAKCIHSLQTTTKATRGQAIPEEKSIAITSVKDKMESDIAVIGMSCRFPNARNIEAYWDLLCEQTSGIRDISDPIFASRRVAAEIKELPAAYEHLKMGGYLENIDLFDPAFFNISPTEAASMDPQHRILLETCWEALEDAGITLAEMQNERIGVFIGISTNEYYHLQCKASGGKSVYAGTGNAGSIAANRMSYLFNINGPSMAVDTACSSSLVAVHQACQSILNGECHTAIVGATNLILSSTLGKIFSDNSMISKEGKSRPFDESSKGYVRGEGAGILILQSAKKAKRVKRQIHAWIKGTAINQDGKSNGLTAPSGLAQQNVINLALQKAKVQASEVSYVETHGTGTALGDPIEFNALNAVYGKSINAHNCYLGAVKSNIGHLETCAGMAGLIKTILVLKNKYIPANLNVESVNTKINLENTALAFALQGQDYQGKNRIAAVSSFGFGGTNSHVILTNAETEGHDQDAPVIDPRRFQLLSIAAKSQKALKALAEAYLKLLEETTPSSFTAICQASNKERTHFAYRIAVSGDSTGRLKQKLSNRLTKKNLTTRAKHQNLQLLFAFGGQGTQYARMAKDLYYTNPFFKENVDRCDQLFEEELAYSVKRLLFESEVIPNSTYYTQALVFTVEYALAQLWMSWNIFPNAVVGHSLGEYVAACIAGVFSLEDACKLVAWRAKLMREESCRGKMLSITATKEEVSLWIAPYEGALSIAAINGSENIVISGEASLVEKIETQLIESQTKCKMLKVSEAFHSPKMAGMIDAFEAILLQISFQQPRLNFISAMTGQVESTAIVQASYWLKHILAPVDFHSACQTIIEQEYDGILELSPHPVLMNLFVANDVGLAQVLGSLHRKEDNWESIFKTLGRLYEMGAKIDWGAIHQAFPVKGFVALPKYPFQRRSFWFQDEKQAEQGIIENGQNGLETVEHKDDIVSSLAPHPSTLNTAAPESERDFILEKLKNSIGELLGILPEEVPVDTSLLDMGADSIVVIHAVKKIQQIFEVELSARQLFEKLSSLEALATYIQANSPVKFGSTMASTLHTDKRVATTEAISASATAATQEMLPLHQMEQLKAELLRALNLEIKNRVSSSIAALLETGFKLPT